jgi:hypothetical protein
METTKTRSKSSPIDPSPLTNANHPVDLRRQVEKLQETVDNINSGAQADDAYTKLQEELNTVRRESEAKNRALQEQLEKSEQRITRLESVTEKLLHLVHTFRVSVIPTLQLYTHWQAQANVGEPPSVNGKLAQKDHIDGSAYSPLVLTHHRLSKPWMEFPGTRGYFSHLVLSQRECTPQNLYLPASIQTMQRKLLQMQIPL